MTIAFLILLLIFTVILLIPTQTFGQSDNCDSSYPDFCIRSPPPDLNCDDIPDNNFKVLPPDPHELDGFDGDGIGCETELQP